MRVCRSKRGIPVKSKKKPIRKQGRSPLAPRAARTRRSPDAEPPIVLDYVLNRISLYNESCGGGVNVRKDARGYTLYLEDGNTPIARLRPRKGAHDYEILCWSPFRQRWQQVGQPGDVVLPLDEALDFISNDPMDCFWY
jgi:hypothetical protein